MFVVATGFLVVVVAVGFLVVVVAGLGFVLITLGSCLQRLLQVSDTSVPSG